MALEKKYEEPGMQDKKKNPEVKKEASDSLKVDKKEVVTDKNGEGIEQERPLTKKEAQEKLEETKKSIEKIERALEHIETNLPLTEQEIKKYEALSKAGKETVEDYIVLANLYTQKENFVEMQKVYSRQYQDHVAEIIQYEFIITKREEKEAKDAIKNATKESIKNPQ